MAVAYDNGAVVRGSGVTTVTTSAFTISGANRVAMIGFVFDAGVTGITASCGSASASQIASAQGGPVSGVRTDLWGAVAPSTGSQTATASWTTSSFMSLNVLTATGVAQTGSFTNGTAGSGASAFTLAVTSANGDLTVTEAADDLQQTTITSNQTIRSQDFGAEDTGPGTGTTSHIWTSAGRTLIASGVNLVQAAAAGGDIAASSMYAGPSPLFFRAGRA